MEWEGKPVCEVKKINKVSENGKISKMNKLVSMEEEIFISFFTDPMCAWSWAFEEEWQKLKRLLGEHLHVTYHMGDLFRIGRRSTIRSIQLHDHYKWGLVWMHIAETTKVKIDPAIWMRDPPTSSYPACIAFKCAELQSKQAAELYLCILRGGGHAFWTEYKQDGNPPNSCCESRPRTCGI